MYLFWKTHEEQEKISSLLRRTKKKKKRKLYTWETVLSASWKKMKWKTTNHPCINKWTNEKKKNEWMNEYVYTDRLFFLFYHERTLLDVVPL